MGGIRWAIIQKMGPNSILAKDIELYWIGEWQVRGNVQANQPSAGAGVLVAPPQYSLLYLLKSKCVQLPEMCMHGRQQWALFLPDCSSPDVQWCVAPVGPQCTLSLRRMWVRQQHCVTATSSFCGVCLPMCPTSIFNFSNRILFWSLTIIIIYYLARQQCSYH